MKTKIKVYRHIYHKDLFLARNWNYCGGNYTTPFYYATHNLVEAVAAANREGFTSWFSNFLDESGKTQLIAKIVEEKEIEIDGYTGVLKKECCFPVYEFECIELTEQEES